MTGLNRDIRAAGHEGEKSEQEIAFLPKAPMPADLPQAPIAIADMANAFGVTHRTLHFYEEKGLLKSARLGPMRTYSEYGARKMAVINSCREVGMPIVVIQEMMAELTSAQSQKEADQIYYNAMMVRKRELVAGLSTVRRQMQQISNIMDTNPAGFVPPTNDNSGDGELSEKELSCLKLMADGQPSERIASALGLTEDQAYQLETDLVRRFHANNRFQAVAKAVLLGLVE